MSVLAESCCGQCFQWLQQHSSHIQPAGYFDSVTSAIRLTWLPERQSAGANHELHSLSTACSSHNETAHVILYSETLIKCSLEELKTGDDDESKVVSQLCQTVAGRLID